MSNSSLVSYKKLSPNCTKPRNKSIDTVSIHCAAGSVSVETLGDIFYPKSRQASSNYGIGSDGRVGMYVEEKNRSWCTSSSSNDNRAITIEVSNSQAKAPWPVSDVVMDSLVTLLVDICQRNNINKLLWEADKSLIGQVDKQNMTVHRWFANKECPGDYLYEKHGWIADQVNAILLGNIIPDSKPAVRYGSKNDYVKELQKLLYITADGIFGIKTLSAVKTFQKLNSLVVDGIVGPKTWNALLK